MRAVDWSVLLLAAFEIPSLLFSQYRANSIRVTVTIMIFALTYTAVGSAIRSNLQAAFFSGLLGLGGGWLAILRSEPVPRKCQPHGRGWAYESGGLPFKAHFAAQSLDSRRMVHLALAGSAVRLCRSYISPAKTKERACCGGDAGGAVVDCRGSLLVNVPRGFLERRGVLLPTLRISVSRPVT